MLLADILPPPPHRSLIKYLLQRQDGEVSWVSGDGKKESQLSCRGGTTTLRFQKGPAVNQFKRYSASTVNAKFASSDYPRVGKPIYFNSITLPVEITTKGLRAAA